MARYLINGKWYDENDSTNATYGKLWGPGSAQWKRMLMMRKITLDRENNTLVISTEPKTEEIHFQSLPDKEDIRFQLKKELADIVAQVKELKQRAEEIQEMLSLLGPRETQLK